MTCSGPDGSGDGPRSEHQATIGVFVRGHPDGIVGRSARLAMPVKVRRHIGAVLVWAGAAGRLGRREESATATHQRILEAATELMTLSGFHPVAIDDIATRADTTRPTIYRHFGSKVGLFEAVAWNVLATAGIERLDEARQLADPVAALREFLRANGPIVERLRANASAGL